MWKAWAEWFTALIVTAAVAVSVFGAIEWIEGRGAIKAVSAVKAVVVVDAGHGGEDGGAVGSRTGVKEATLNLAVAQRVSALLKERGVSVVMTRSDDKALAATKQADMAARRSALNGPDVTLAVSIHMNAFPDAAVSGAMAYYMSGSEQGRQLAQCVIDRICDGVGHSRRLANPGDYFVLRECVCPAVLVECGFLTNASDEQALQTPAHQETLARAIVEGVADYLSAQGEKERTPSDAPRVVWATS